MSESKQTAPAGGGMQKTLSIWNFFTIGFGAIIGTGWVLLVGDWMIIGGGPIAPSLHFCWERFSCFQLVQYLVN